VKYIQNRAVIGDYQPHRTEKVITTDKRGRQIKRVNRIPTGEIVKGYYPAIVSEDLFRRAQAVSETRLTKARGAGWRPNAGGRKGLYYTNLFAGLCQCVVCGRSFVVKGPSPRQGTRLRCSGDKTGLCSNSVKVDYDPLEVAILDWGMTAAFFGNQRGEDTTALDNEIAGKAIERDDLLRRIKNLEDQAEEGQPLGERLMKRRSELAELERALVDLEKRRATLKSSLSPEERRAQIKTLRAHMGEATGPERFALRARIAQQFREMLPNGMAFHPDGWVEVRAWKQYRAMFKDGKYAGMLDATQEPAFRQWLGSSHGFLPPYHLKLVKTDVTNV